MPPEPNQPRSLRADTRDSIGRFLYEEGFPRCPHTPDGILALFDSIASYTEEGVRLYPELLLTISLEETIAPLSVHRLVVVKEVPRTAQAFAQALKHCAPLARDGWVIFLELIGDDRLRYGVISAEASELSPSIHQHLVGDLAVREDQQPVAYLRCTGPRQVRLSGNRAEIAVALSLQENHPTDGTEITAFVSKVTEDVGEPTKEMIHTFLLRTLESAIQQTHGCLLGVVNDAEFEAGELRGTWPDGIYLEEPVNFVDLIMQSEETKSREASTAVRSYGNVLRGMISQDGVTLLSSAGRVLGYRIFVPGQPQNQGEPNGGARARAFASMIGSGLLTCCLAVSHDGGVSLWEAN